MVILMGNERWGSVGWAGGGGRRASRADSAIEAGRGFPYKISIYSLLILFFSFVLYPGVTAPKYLSMLYRTERALP